MTRENNEENVGPGVRIRRPLNWSSTKDIKDRIFQVEMSLKGHLAQLSFNIRIPLNISEKGLLTWLTSWKPTILQGSSFHWDK